MHKQMVQMKLMIMLHSKLWLLLLLFSQLVFAAPALDGNKIFLNSTKFFSLPTISFVVDAEIEQGSTRETRSFLIAKKSYEIDRYVLLMRFIQPSEIKCSAVLIQHHSNKSVNRSVYFPALGRVRIIPEQDSAKEVLGLGITYDDLGNPKKEFSETESITEKGEHFYKLSNINGNKKSVYYIDKKDNFLKKIAFFENEKLTKRVIVQETLTYNNELLINRWLIDDIKNKKKVQFNIRKDTITDNFKENILQKNKLDRCIFEIK